MIISITCSVSDSFLDVIQWSLTEVLHEIAVIQKMELALNFFFLCQI